MINKELEDSYIPFQCIIINNINRFKIEGVSTAQYNVLDILDKQGSKTAKELSEMRSISQAGMSKLIIRLLKKNYIIKKQHKTDRRTYDIFITPEGKNFLLKSKNFRNEILTLIEKSLNEKELENFIQFCKKISTSYIEDKV